MSRILEDSFIFCNRFLLGQRLVVLKEALDTPLIPPVRKPADSFHEREAVRVRDAVIDGAVRVAKALSPHLMRLDERLRQHFAGDRYARYSESRKLHEALAPVLRECKGLTREHLDQEAAEAVGRLAPLEPVEGFEAARRRANSLFISNTIPSVQTAAAVAGRPGELTATEYDMLFELSVNSGRVTPHEHLLGRVCGLDSSDDTGLVRTIAKRLRRKLGDDAKNPRYIPTLSSATGCRGPIQPVRKLIFRFAPANPHTTCCSERGVWVMQREWLPRKDLCIMVKRRSGH